jgi:hypothetical protein
MPRRYRGHASRRRRYDDDEYYSPHYYHRRRGCWGSIQHFFHSVAITLLVLIGSVVFVLLVLLIVFHFALFIQILMYLLYTAAGLALLGVIYLIVRMIAAMANAISTASANRAKAKLEHERVRQSQVQTQKGGVEVQSQRVRLAQERYVFQQKQLALEERMARPTRNFQDSSQAHSLSEPLVRRLPEPAEPPPENDVPELAGMPRKGQVFRYRDYVRLLHPGELIAGIRADGTAQIATWAEFKILLILGSSSSGKTTTIVEKCVCAVRSGGWLVICDPHAFKPDSLTRRISSLQRALLPGTTMAMEHAEIMRNVRAVHNELERRRRGGDMRTPIYLVIEELNRLMRDKAIADELSSFIEEMGQEARGYNIFVILCAQRATGLANIRNSVIAFICHRVNPMESSKIIPGRYAKWTGELGVGQTFVIDGDGTVQALQQTLIEERDVAAEASRLAPPQQHTGHMTTGTPRLSQQQRPESVRQSAPQTSTTLRPTRLTQQSMPLSPSGPATSATWQQRPASRPASATWGDPPPAQHHAKTWGQVPEARPITQAIPPAVDPFNALAALRDQQRRKKKS